jgi:5-methylcytosine-specific restriction endonuclease McrA
MPSKPRSLAGILHRRRSADAEYNRTRRSDPDRGVEDAVVSSARWKSLRDEPRCRTCAAAGRTELATQVDHIVPVRVRPDLAYDRANAEPLCGR